MTAQPVEPLRKSVTMGGQGLRLGMGVTSCHVLPPSTVWRMKRAPWPAWTSARAHPRRGEVMWISVRTVGLPPRGALVGSGERIGVNEAELLLPWAPAVAVARVVLPRPNPPSVHAPRERTMKTRSARPARLAAIRRSIIFNRTGDARS